MPIYLVSRMIGIVMETIITSCQEQLSALLTSNVQENLLLVVVGMKAL